MHSRLVDVIFGKRKPELRENAFSFLNDTFIFEFYTSFSTTYQKQLCNFSSPLMLNDINVTAGTTFTFWAIPWGYQEFKAFRFSADFISFGKQVHICGPMDARLFEPKVT